VKKIRSIALLVAWIMLGHALLFGQNKSESTQVALEALSRLKGIDLEANPAVKNAILKLLDQIKGTPEFVDVVFDYKIAGQESALLEYAIAHPANSVGTTAMRLVLYSAQTNLIKEALAGTNAWRLITALGNTGENEIVPFLQPLPLDRSRELGIREAAVLELCNARKGAELLLKLAKEKKLPEDLRLQTSAVLNYARWPEIKAEAALVLPLTQLQNSTPLPPISELLQRSGDPVNGAAVFQRENVGCIKCHQVHGEGIDFGPNLSEIGTKLGKDALYESILDPSAGISFGYEAWQLEFKNGDEAYGLVTSETEDEVVIKAVGGVSTHYKKADIAKRTKQKLSIMPAGLQQNMAAQELVDLVEYLASLKKTSL
jgi:putative heme-binding domain-containing protein